jgi:hypothetical protein
MWPMSALTATLWFARSWAMKVSRFWRYFRSRASDEWRYIQKALGEADAASMVSSSPLTFSTIDFQHH